MERGTESWNNFNTDSAPRRAERRRHATPARPGAEQRRDIPRVPGFPPGSRPGACAAPGAGGKPRDYGSRRPLRDYSSRRPPRAARAGWESRCVYRRGPAPPRERWRHPREPPSLPVGSLIFMSRARAGSGGRQRDRSLLACLPPSLMALAIAGERD